MDGQGSFETPQDIREVPQASGDLFEVDAHRSEAVSALRTVAKIESSPTLSLCAHKLTLFQLAGGFGRALEKALEAGLAVSVFALDAVNQDSRVSAEFKTKPDVWLEAAVHQALLHFFGQDEE